MRITFLNLFYLNVFLSTVFAQQNELKFEIDYDGSDYQMISTYQVEIGDSIMISVEGKIVVGYLAGDRNADGMPNYSGGQYNLYPQWPHCAMLVGISLQQTITNVAQQNWLLCKSKLQFKAEKKGYLAFYLNESYGWRWDNRPVGRGMVITVRIKSGKTYLGKLKEQPVYQKDQVIYYDQMTFTKSPSDGLWHIKNKQNVEIGIYHHNQKGAYLFEYIQEIKGSPLYLHQERGLIYYNGQIIERANDSYWHLKNQKQQEIGIYSSSTPNFFEEIGMLKNKKVYANWQWKTVLYQGEYISPLKDIAIWIIKDFTGQNLGIAQESLPYLYSAIGTFPAPEQTDSLISVFVHPNSTIAWLGKTPVRQANDGIWYFRSSNQELGIGKTGSPPTLLNYIGELKGEKVYKNNKEVFYKKQFYSPNEKGQWNLLGADPEGIVYPTEPYLRKSK